MEIALLNPTDIHVAEGLERYRTEMGDLEALAKSIKDTRQILPIIISRDHKLIDGGRRLAACMLAGVKVKCVYEDVVDNAELRELEIEANCHRKDFTPAEKAKAIRDLHLLKQARYGKATVGSLNSGWTTAQTAQTLNMSRSQLERQIEVAEMVDAFPELKAAKKTSDIVKAAKGLQRLAIAAVGAKKHAEIISANKDTFSLVLGDALEHMSSMPDSSIHLLLTDPIFGIDADKTAINIGGVTGSSITSSGYTISDRKKDAYRYYKALAKESYRFCTPDAHGYVFLAPEHFHIIKKMFQKAGWRVNVKPLIWIKREVGQNNVPAAWPSSCYEMFMYIRKDASVLVKQGQPDWVECQPVPSTAKTHPYEKPVPLLTNLIMRSALPGQHGYDPFMGSGASIEAMVKAKLFATGVDINNGAYLSAQARMAKIAEAIKNGTIN